VLQLIMVVVIHVMQNAMRVKLEAALIVVLKHVHKEVINIVVAELKLVNLIVHGVLALEVVVLV
jgi:hypothetical protein